MKSEAMNRLILELTGIDTNKAITEKICPSCNKPVKDEDFTDEISKKEFLISGMCQSCQNEIWHQCFYPSHKRNFMRRLKILHRVGLLKENKNDDFCISK